MLYTTCPKCRSPPPDLVGRPRPNYTYTVYTFPFKRSITKRVLCFYKNVQILIFERKKFSDAGVKLMIWAEASKIVFSETHFNLMETPSLFETHSQSLLFSWLRANCCKRCHKITLRSSGNNREGNDGRF